MFEKLFRRRHEGLSYKFFHSEQGRKNLYILTKRLCEFMREQGVASLILLDRSARPLYAGVKEYYAQAHPGQASPHIYFMNPLGFKSKEHLHEWDNLQLMTRFEDGDLDSRIEHLRSKEDIKQEVERAYSQLMRDRHQPVMIFDTCIHSGTTLAPVVSLLKEVGVDDIFTGAGHFNFKGLSLDAVRLVPDMVTHRSGSGIGCHPFGLEATVRQTLLHVYSTPEHKADALKMAKQLRDEIRMVVKDEYGKAHQKKNK